MFEPQLNQKLKSFLPKSGQVRKNQILFYGRPTVDRNCFPIIIEGLREWASKEKNHPEWRIISIGENHPAIKLKGDHRIESLGKLSLAAYAKLLTESAIGISFMVSPHPSYPPLEMAHFGLLTLTNSYAKKNLSNYHQNIISLGRLTPNTVSDGISKLIDRFTNDPLIGSTANSMMPSFIHSKNQFPFINDLISEIYA